MITQKFNILRFINIALDSIIVLLALCLASLIRGIILQDYSYPCMIFFRQEQLALVGLVLLWNYLLRLHGLYPTIRLRSLFQVSWIIFKVTITAIAVCVFIITFAKMYFVSRLTLILFGGFIFFISIAKELILRELFKISRLRGRGLRNVLIVGERSFASKITESIENNPYLGLKVAGVCDLGKDLEEQATLCVEVLGNGDNIQDILIEKHIDNVIVAVSKDKFYEVEEIVLKCEEFGAEIWLYADIFELMFAQREVDMLDNKPILIFRTTPGPSVQLMFKRLIDIVGSIILFILTSPLFVISAVGIKLTSPGPVIFRQKRAGLHGRLFTFYKFRSMRTDAEQRRDEIKGRNMMTGPVFKVINDPRITSFGRFLRKSSIDELPQLWNVLKGEMSLVGPRPPIPSEVKEYHGWQRRRLSMKPGITCFWQVGGRNKIRDFSTWAELDLKYIDNWSLWLDMVILLRTIPAVILRIGAE